MTTSTTTATLALAGKTALVTGGSNGIGAAISHAYAAAGANVVFTYNKDPDSASHVAAAMAALGGEVRAVQADLAQPGAAQQVWQEALALTGEIDVLVNNAGTMTRSEFLAVTQHELERVMAVNFYAPWHLSRQLAEHLIARKAPGSVLNISSVSAHFARSRMPHYQCSKAALNMLTKSIAYELAPHGIRANSISAGLTCTNANRDQWEGQPALWDQRASGIPLGRPGMPRDHAGLAVFLASDEASWITGADIMVDGGSTVI
jgi:NAD(P)-dependent dehydrogenase (short-subunit alcohol dehydrogenase family)